MADAIKQDIEVFRGDDRSVTCTLNANGSIAAWTAVLYVRTKHDASGDPLISAVGSVSDAGSVSTPGVLAFTLTKAQLLALAAGRYYYTVKRVNSGAERVLTYGVMTVKNDGEHAP